MVRCHIISVSFSAITCLPSSQVAYTCCGGCNIWAQLPLLGIPLAKLLIANGLLILKPVGVLAHGAW